MSHKDIASAQYEFLNVKTFRLLEINIEMSQVMRVFWRNELLRYCYEGSRIFFIVD